MSGNVANGWVFVLAVSGLVLGCSSDPDAGTSPAGNGTGGTGVSCGPGTHLDGGVCLPDEGGAAGQGGTAGTGGAAGVGGSSGSMPDDAGPDATEDVGTDVFVPQCNGACGSLGCGTCPTLPMIGAEDPTGHKYEIDSLETTVGEYQHFLSQNVAKQTDEDCDWNETYEPDPEWFLYPEPDNPIHAVDWCDARAYCEWAGKRLCKGKYGYLDSAQHSEFYNACSLGGTRKYPYGNTYDETACPKSDEYPPPPYAPGTVTSCEGGYAGLFDMAGNLWEWTDECGTQTGPSAGCNLYGGELGTLGCSTAHLGAFRSGVGANLGFRCCR